MNENREIKKKLDFPAFVVYDSTKATNGGANVDIKNILVPALKAVNKTQGQAAKAMNWQTQQLNARIVRNSLRASEFMELMDAIGIDVILKIRDTGDVIREDSRIPGAGRRVCKMVDKVTYDTNHASALANSFFADGVNEFNDEGKASELYIDQEGRYFFAEYTNWEGGKDTISPTTAAVAAKFIEKYGTEINKAPTE